MRHLLVSPLGLIESKAPNGYAEQQILEYLQNSLQLNSSISLKSSSLPNLQAKVRQVKPALFSLY